MSNKLGILPTRSAAGVAIALLMGAIATPGHAGEARQIAITNGARSVITALQLKPNGGAWVEILARKRLAVREKVAYKLPPGPCAPYAIRAVFDDGHTLTKNNQNLCSPSYLLTDF